MAQKNRPKAALSIQELFPVFYRAETRFLFKEPGKIRWVLKTKKIGRFADGFLRRLEQVLCFRHQKNVDKFQSGFPCFLPQQVAQVTRRGIKRIGHGLYAGQAFVLKLAAFKVRR